MEKKVTRVIKIYRNQRIAFSLVARESIHYRTRVWSLAVFPEPVVASATMWKGSMAFLLQECQARPWPLKESVEWTFRMFSSYRLLPPSWMPLSPVTTTMRFSQLSRHLRNIEFNSKNIAKRLGCNWNAYLLLISLLYGNINFTDTKKSLTLFRYVPSP